ncbi:succinate dehydrogenase assembly factor 2 [Legionella maceachernii]|uniref:FAD assembly factor SdhE n=1 Tax=Legionella maceachernii TaxID=466 RepID=A0A0W0VTV1_9GAMM|nr:succinate dehydrogenase assembly factor 2 [Legionella maceachernii]KTD23514.1 Antitoxin CptB [Legionella maceachernii]SJZ69979.1 antitoxin CptB [Legionella maceachernii]SUP02243.1 Flavinator of succinate dehydrogenase [Legionella maceachernii]
MSNSLKKAKLLWHSRRGMLELDLILIPFVERQFDTMNSAQIASFEKLLDCTDPELFSWLMGHAEPVDKELNNIVEFIRMQDYIR